MNFQFVANNVQVLSIDHNQSADGSIEWDTIVLFDPRSRRCESFTADKRVIPAVSVGDNINALIDATEGAKLSSNQKSAYIETKFRVVNIAPCSSEMVIKFPPTGAIGAPGFDGTLKAAKSKEASK